MDLLTCLDQLSTTQTTIFHLIYWPPWQNKDFVDEFSDILATLSIRYAHIALFGDFNLTNNTSSKKWDSLFNLNVVRHVTQLTLQSPHLQPCLINITNNPMQTTHTPDWTDHFHIPIFLPTNEGQNNRKDRTFTSFKGFSTYSLILELIFHSINSMSTNFYTSLAIFWRTM